MKKSAVFFASILSILMILVCASFAFAETLNITDCVNLALKQNPDMLSSLEDKHSAQAQTDAAWASVFPKLTAETSYTRLHSYQQALTGEAFGGIMGGFAQIYKKDHPTADLSALQNGSSSLAADSIDNYGVKISAQQILYSGSVFAAIEASQYGINLADNAILAKKNALTYSTKEAYINTLKAQEMYLAALENKKLIEQLINQTQSMIQAGLATKADLLKLQLSLKNLEQALIGADSGKKLAQQQLNLTIGLPIQQTNRLAPIKTADYELYTSLNIAELVNQAAINRKELAVMDYQIKLYHAQKAAIASAAQPMVLAMGSYGYQNTEMKFTNDQRDWLVGVTAKWNFFDAGDTQAKVDNTEATINKIKLQKKQLINGIELEISGICSAISASIAKIEAAQKENELANENVNIAKEKYVSGLGTNLELINAQTSLFTAQTDLINAQYDFELAKAKLYKALGATEKI